MSTFEMSDLGRRVLNEWLNAALEAAALVAVDEIVKVAPRNLEDLPKNINRKDGKTPIRRWKRKPVMIFGNWYEWVTGNLQKSIAYERRRNKVYVGVTQHGGANEYAKHLEYGTRYIRPKRYIRNTIKDEQVRAKMMKEAQDAFALYLSRF